MGGETTAEGGISLKMVNVAVRKASYKGLSWHMAMHIYPYLQNLTSKPAQSCLDLTNILPTHHSACALTASCLSHLLFFHLPDAFLTPSRSSFLHVCNLTFFSKEVCCTQQSWIPSPPVTVHRNMKISFITVATQHCHHQPSRLTPPGHTSRISTASTAEHLALSPRGRDVLSS